MNQRPTVPSLLRQRMSALPSPLKSAVPAICHDSDVKVGSKVAVTGCAVPCMIQTPTVPSLLRHRMSASWSPLKSATPAICHDSGAKA